MHSPDNTTASRSTEKLWCMLETQVMTVWLCGKSVGIQSWWRCSRDLPLSLDPVGRKFILLFPLTLTETTAEYLQKMAEVIDFIENNWTLIFSHLFSCWLGFLDYLPGEKQPRAPVSQSFKDKVFSHDKVWYGAVCKLQDVTEPQKPVFDFNVGRSDIT